jgi:hypothetical protein
MTVRDADEMVSIAEPSFCPSIRVLGSAVMARTRTRYEWSSARRIRLNPGDNESRDRKILSRPGTLKTEAGKGSVSTAVGHGSLGTKANATSRGKAHHSSWVVCGGRKSSGFRDSRSAP